MTVDTATDVSILLASMVTGYISLLAVLEDHFKIVKLQCLTSVMMNAEVYVKSFCKIKCTASSCMVAIFKILPPVFVLPLTEKYTSTILLILVQTCHRNFHLLSEMSYKWSMSIRKHNFF